MGRLAAQQAAEGNDGVYSACVGQSARSGWNLPCAGNANHFNVTPLCAAAQQGIKRAVQQPLSDHRIPAGDDNAKLHARSGEITLDGQRLATRWICPGPETEGEAKLRLDGKEARLPVRFRDGREARNSRFAPLCAQPGGGGLMHGVQSGHLHQHVGGGRELAIHKFQVAQRSQKRCAAAGFIFPSIAGSKSQRRKEARQPVISRSAACWTKIGNPLDHYLILPCAGGAGRFARESCVRAFPLRVKRGTDGVAGKASCRKTKRPARSRPFCLLVVAPRTTWWRVA